MAAYTVLADALAFVKDLTSITTKDSIATQKLTDSAGTLTTEKTVDGSTQPAETTIYRPYWVSAKLLSQSRQDQAIKVADGVTFTNLETMIASLMDEQMRIDQSLQLDIPEGYAAVLSLIDGSAPVMSIFSS